MTKRTFPIVRSRRADFGPIEAMARITCARCGDKDEVVLGTRGAGEWIAKKFATGGGWGTALKPAFEPIVFARRPLIGTIAANVAAHGTGAINIDGCRVHADDAAGGTYTVKRFAPGASVNRDGNWKQDVAFVGEMKPGRWPANVVHDGSVEVVSAFPSEAGASAPVRGSEASSVSAGIYGDRARIPGTFFDDKGSAARFFYSSKASAADRVGSRHPTVKPLDLMQWLVRLVTPKGGVVLDAFAGTGTTGEAAWREGMRAVLIEREARYAEDIRRRLRLATRPAERAAVAKAKGRVAEDHGPLFTVDKHNPDEAAHA